MTLPSMTRQSLTYKRELSSKFPIDMQDHTTFFNTGWDDLKGCFEHLQMFCGGLANAFANTTSVNRILAFSNGRKMTFDSQ